MNKTVLAIAAVALLLIVIFGADYWLRANKQFVGGEVVDSSIQQPGASAGESFETQFKNATAAKTPEERAPLLLALDSQVASRGGAEAQTRRRQVLSELLRTCPDHPAAAQAANNLFSLDLADGSDAALAAGVKRLLETAEHLGIYEKGIHPRTLENLAQTLVDRKHQALADQLLAAVASPENYGPEPLREATGFRVGTSLAAAPFPAADEVDYVYRLKRRNLTKTPFAEELRWFHAQQGPWSIDPLDASLTLAPGEEKTLEFHVKFNHAKGDAVPFPFLRSTIKRENEPDTVQFARVPMDTTNYRAVRIARCVRVARPPVIDGKLDDDAWTRAKPTSNLLRPDGFSHPKNDTTVFTCYDDKGLYVAYRVHEADMQHVTAGDWQRDGNVWRDDSVEFVLNTRPEQLEYFHFILNSKNVQYDGIGLDIEPSFKWESATGSEENAWTVELFLPWPSFVVEEVPKPGEKMIVNFFRNRYRDNYVLTQWSPAFTINNHKQEYYGTLLFE